MLCRLVWFVLPNYSFRVHDFNWSHIKNEKHPDKNSFAHIQVLVIFKNTDESCKRLRVCIYIFYSVSCIITLPGFVCLG